MVRPILIEVKVVESSHVEAHRGCRDNESLRVYSFRGNAQPLNVTSTAYPCSDLYCGTHTPAKLRFGHSRTDSSRDSCWL